MYKLTIILLLIPVIVSSHPGIGIVRDSKGDIYYSDLEQVWSIHNGHKSIAVPSVHTHELYIDKNDNLYGEHLWFVNAADNTFAHFLWVLHPNGKLDTVISRVPAYIKIDFSLSRDSDGNEYYTKTSLRESDSEHIYKRGPGGMERIIASGKFADLKWLHPQQDGGLLYFSGNSIYRLIDGGKPVVIAPSLATGSPTSALADSNTQVWGLWQDNKSNLYAAVFNEQVVRKIDRNGRMTDYYHSPGNWKPVHGLFDNNGMLWLLEASAQNEVRVTTFSAAERYNYSPATFLAASVAFVLLVILARRFQMCNNPSG